MESKLVLDTNAYTRCLNAEENVLDALSSTEKIFMPCIVYGELLYGFKCGSKLLQNVKKLDDFIERFAVEIIPVDKSVAKKFGDIYAYLKKIGKPIPTNDLWIAACTMEIGGCLLTVDKHFLMLPQIEVQFLD